MKCKKCGKIYKLGRNGIIGGCDTCLGIRREKDGTFWRREETYQDRIPVGKKPDAIYRVSRKDVFPDERI
jgi:predicted  nucleic acid-binding Zn-ribbon protein